MKKSLLIFTILSSVFVLAQEDNYPPPTMSSGTRAVEPMSYANVEKLPEFPGGINAFRTKLAANFRTKKVTGNGTIRTLLKFKISKSGEVSEITATGNNAVFNNEAISAVKKIKTKWFPAINDGKPVEYNYMMPVAMVFD